VNRNEIDELLAALKSTGDAPETEIFETHVSWVIVTPSLAYKIKKPVRFYFLDFSKPDRRKYYCEREVELNRRTASELYLGVVPICRDQSLGINVQGVGEPIDWAVKMKKVDPGKSMNHLLKVGLVSQNDMVAIAQDLARFHSQAEIVENKISGSPECILRNMRQNTEHLCEIFESIDGTIARKAHSLLDFFENNFASKQEILQERQNTGRIRDCHGDLRSANIFLWDRPIFLDCIEFNDDFRFTDVANDVGSLIADLRFWERHDLSGIFLETYLQKSKDISLPTVLPLYIASWGVTLAQVAGHELAQAKTNQKKQELCFRARKFVEVAVQALKE
jgi:aminoglycoside phosphotransferase family enzyme